MRPGRHKLRGTEAAGLPISLSNKHQANRTATAVLRPNSDITTQIASKAANQATFKQLLDLALPQTLTPDAHHPLDGNQQSQTSQQQKSPRVYTAVWYQHQYKKLKGREQKTLSR
jgi:hypothetical protein